MELQSVLRGVARSTGKVDQSGKNSSSITTPWGGGTNPGQRVESRDKCLGDHFRSLASKHSPDLFF